MRIIVILYGVLCAVAWAEADRPNLSGSWRLDPAKSDIVSGKSSALTWVISETDDVIQIKQLEKDENGRDREAGLKCGIGGMECSFRQSGSEAKAMFWYNGPVLVEMLTQAKGDRISKTRIKLIDEGKALDVEVKSIVPPQDKPEHLVFTKQDQGAAIAKAK